MARILRGSGKRSGVGKDPVCPADSTGAVCSRPEALLGAAAVLTSNKAAFAQTSGSPTPPVLCGIDPPISPATTPFRDTLPVPPPAWPVLLNPLPTEAANIAGGEAARAKHQRWAQFFPLLHYRMNAAPSLHRHHTDLLPSYMWTFNGKYPAPTPLNFYGVPSIVRFKNNLPEGAQNTTFGVPEITVHLHNGHTASESDGFAQDFFLPPLFKDNHYANAYAGIDDFGGIGDPREAMRTFWFHDHRAAFTANNNYLGLNGMYIVYDAKDPGHELATSGSLRLPGYYGITDIPLILTDKRFCAAANGRNEVFQVIGDGAPGGDKWVVNGKIQPRLTVRRRKYRFRVLNTGPAKSLDAEPHPSRWHASPDDRRGGRCQLHDKPVRADRRPLNVQVAMRFDIIIDFAAFPAGTSVYLKEATAQNVGVVVPDPAIGLPIGNVLMRFDVVNRESWFPADTPPIPGRSSRCRTPSFRMPRSSGNSRSSADSSSSTGRRSTTTASITWCSRAAPRNGRSRTTSPPATAIDPVHIHFEERRTMSRRVRVSQNPDVFQNLPLLPEELGRRDVYPLPPQNRRGPAHAVQGLRRALPDPLPQHEPRGRLHDGTLGHRRDRRGARAPQARDRPAANARRPAAAVQTWRTRL